MLFGCSIVLQMSGVSIQIGTAVQQYTLKTELRVRSSQSGCVFDPMAQKPPAYVVAMVCSMSMNKTSPVNP